MCARRFTHRLFAALIALALVGALAGCEQQLFPENLPRNQYERYDRLRGRIIPNERFSPTGMPAPALRERLSPNAQ